MRRMPLLDRRQLLRGKRGFEIGERRHARGLYTRGEGRARRGRGGAGGRGANASLRTPPPAAPLRSAAARRARHPPQQQALALERSRQLPAAGRVGAEPEAAVIVAVADQQDGVVAERVGAGERGGDQREADALSRHARDHRAEQGQRRDAAICRGKFDRPILDRAVEPAVRAPRDEAERGDRHRAVAQPVGGAAAAVGSEARIEQRLDRRRIGSGRGLDQHGRSVPHRLDPGTRPVPPHLIWARGRPQPSSGRTSAPKRCHPGAGRGPWPCSARPLRNRGPGLRRGDNETAGVTTELPGDTDAKVTPMPG